MVISVDLSLLVMLAVMMLRWMLMMMWMTLFLLQTHVAVQFLEREKEEGGGDSIKNQFPEVLAQYLFTRKFLAISYRTKVTVAN